MTIEEEFFKSFNIPTKFYTTVNLGDLDNNYQEVSSNTLQELFEQNNFWFDEYIEDIKDFHDWEEKYPSITSEIVLMLIEIILLINDDYNFSVEHFDEEVRFLFCDKRIILENENNLKDCVLKSCINKNDEIQDQVKALFNAM